MVIAGGMQVPFVRAAEYPAVVRERKRPACRWTRLRSPDCGTCEGRMVIAEGMRVPFVRAAE
jgi:hypothetical protein